MLLNRGNIFQRFGPFPVHSRDVCSNKRAAPKKNRHKPRNARHLSEPSVKLRRLCTSADDHKANKVALQEELFPSNNKESLSSHALPKGPVQEQICDSTVSNVFDRLRSYKLSSDDETIPYLSGDEMKDRLLISDDDSSSPNNRRGESETTTRDHQEALVQSSSDCSPRKKKRNLWADFSLQIEGKSVVISDEVPMPSESDGGGGVSLPELVSNDELSERLKAIGLTPTETSDSRVQDKTPCIPNPSSSNLGAASLEYVVPKPYLCRRPLNLLRKSARAHDVDKSLALILLTSSEDCNLKLESWVQQIVSITSTSWRPSRLLVTCLFSRILKEVDANNIQLCYMTLLHINDIHGLPYDMHLWDYLERAYFIDKLFERSTAPLIKTSIFRLFCVILEIHTMSFVRQSKSGFTSHTFPYKLFGIDKDNGLANNILPWLEDTINAYVQHEWRSPEAKSNNASLIDLIICMQKMLAITQLVIKNPEHLVREMQWTFGRLKSNAQRRLFLETISSELILLNLCEQLLQNMSDLTPDVEVDTYKFVDSPCDWNKIVSYYFCLRPIENSDPSCSSPVEKDLPKEQGSVDLVEKFLLLLNFLIKAYGSQGTKIEFETFERHLVRLQTQLEKKFPAITEQDSTQNLFLCMRLAAIS